MNMFHDIPSGENPPENLNAVIEVESGSKDKYEYNEEYESFVLDRILYSPVIFPIDYGFVPRTWHDDGDPLDIMVLSHEPLEVGCIAKVRPIGILVMEDEKGEDSKILAVLDRDSRSEDINDVDDLEKHKLDEIKEFFETYKRLEPNKWVKFKKWDGVDKAKEKILASIELYNKIRKEK